MKIFRRLCALSTAVFLFLGSAAEADSRDYGASESSTNAYPAISQPPAPVAKDTPTTRPRVSPIRLALTLSGGGARGVAHIGVLKVFEEHGIRPTLITGTSAGAMIGSLYAAGLSARQIEEIVLRGEFKKAYFPRPRCLQSILYGTRYSISRLLFMKPKIGLYSGKSISRFIERNLPPGVVEFKDLKIPLVVTSIDLVNTRPVWFSSGKIADAVRASNTVPFMYRSPGSVNGPQLVDGGIRANTPAHIAEVAGAPLVVAVKLHTYLAELPRKNFDTYLDYADRITSIFMAEIEEKAVADADILIQPKVQFMTTNTFEPETIQKAILEGEIAARKMIPEIVAKLHSCKLKVTAP